MKYLCIFLMVFFLRPILAADEHRLRPLDPWATEAFKRVIDLSALARELVSRIESSDLVVYIETLTVMPMGIGGTTRFMASAGGYRYVRISLLRDLQPNDRAAILGHELQHACELAGSEAGDRQAVRELYETLGHRISGRLEFFETRAAMEAGQRVWMELRRRRSESTARASSSTSR